MSLEYQKRNKYQIYPIQQIKERDEIAGSQVEDRSFHAKYFGTLPISSILGKGECISTSARVENHHIGI